MLTKEKYQELWNTHFKNFTEVIMPSYCEYVKREIQFQDYLDLFLGKVTYTRTTEGIITINGCEINIGLHPFEKEIINSGKRKIKYILVAEACPDGGVNYFYDINAIYGQTYLNRTYNAIYRGAAPAIPWRPFTSSNDKINKLLDLASRGVILLDLFPFALPLSSGLRKKLMGCGVIKNFWDGNIYSIKTQIAELCNHDYLDYEWDLCLIAPPTLSCHIVGAYDAISITPCTSRVHNNTTFKTLIPNNKRGCDHKKVAVDTSNNPNATLITVAF